MHTKFHLYIYTYRLTCVLMNILTHLSTYLTAYKHMYNQRKMKMKWKLKTINNCSKSHCCCKRGVRRYAADVARTTSDNKLVIIPTYLSLFACEYNNQYLQTHLHMGTTIYIYIYTYVCIYK